MITEKLLAIGCDNAAVMTNLLNSVKSETVFSNTIVSATRVADLAGISKTLSPDLIILCFENNQNALHYLITSVKKPEIPVLCLTKRNENEMLHWDKSSIVFTFPEENIQKKDHHYFCISDGCAFPLVPAHWHETGVAWYRSEPVTPIHNHVLTCSHRLASGAGASIARNEIGRRIDISQRVLVPTILDKIEMEKVRAWPNATPPTREQIAAQAAKAKQFQLSGDIEDVVDAYEKISYVN